MILRPTFASALVGTVSDATVKITVDGTVVFNEADMSLAAFPIGPTTTTNGLIVTVDNDAAVLPNFRLKIDINTLKVWESTQVRIEVSKTGYIKYDNIFTVYGYDLGNGGVITDNPDFLISMQLTAGLALDLAHIIAYREPFSKRVRYYRGINRSDASIYDATSGTDILVGSSNGFVCNNEEDVILKAKHDTFTQTLTIPKAVWFPDHTLSVDCPNCDDCISVANTQVAQIDFDVTALTVLQVNDADAWAIDDLGWFFKVFNKDGTLVSSKQYGQVVDPSFVYDPTVFDFEDIVLPELGDYIVQGCLTLWGKKTGVTLTSASATVEINKWYRIVDNSGGADFTNIGAAANTVGTDFMATGDTPTAWGTGILEVLDKVYECCENEPIHACNWAELEQTGCSDYVIHNHSFGDVTVQMKELNEDGEFVDFGDTISIPGRSSYTLPISADGEYTVTITDEAEGKEFTFAIHNYCNLRKCLLGFIKNLVCACDDFDECKDYCKDFYDFNALTLAAYTYFNIINEQNSFAAVFDLLNPSDVSKLYSAKQILQRFVDYCNECDTCEDCKTKGKKCSCSH